MYELLSIIVIIFCLVVIGFVIKIYRESPKIKDRNPDDSGY
jgi:hypothetical protein